LLGIKNGLAGIDARPDWRGPVADRLYIPTADGGRAVTDAVTETYNIVNIGLALTGEKPMVPKDGARFHFELPDSVQGFQPDEDIDSKGTVKLENVEGHSERGRRSLAIRYEHIAPGRVARITTPTFIPPEAIDMSDYALLASPTLYPGQEVETRVFADGGNSRAVACRLFVRAYDGNDELATKRGPETVLRPGSDHVFQWRVEDTGGQPMAQIGVEISSDEAADGTAYLDYLTWKGEPDVELRRPAEGGTMWRRAWVCGVDRYDARWPEPYRLIQNQGRGLLIQGTREWNDYRVSAPITPHMVVSAGIGARVQGMRRYYALLLAGGGKAQLIKALDGDTVLAETDFPWQFDVTYDLALEVRDNRLRASIDGKELFEVADNDRTLASGAVAFVCEEGRMESDVIRVQPVERT
jgi:hypothetical protein